MNKNESPLYSSLLFSTAMHENHYKLGLQVMQAISIFAFIIN